MTTLMILYFVAIGGITMTMMSNIVLLFTGLRNIRKARYIIASLGYMGYFISLMAPVVATLEGENVFRIAFLLGFIHMWFMVLFASHHPNVFRSMRQHAGSLHMRQSRVTYKYYPES